MTPSVHPGGNPFVWYELMTSDVAAAQEFYAKVAGWTTSEIDANGAPYTILSANGEAIGGMFGLPDEATAGGSSPGWFGYIAVPDADAALAAMVADGATAHMPVTHIEQVGKIAMLADPHGATFYIIQPEGEGPVTAFSPMPSPGKIGWNELLAADAGQALAFYGRHAGWEEKGAMDMGPMGSYHFFGLPDGATLGALMSRTADMPPPKWKHYIWVDEIDAAHERLKAAGGQVRMGPQEVPGPLFVIEAVDPQGASFALVGERHGSGAE
ncbi:MAG: VOC family protein [Sphingobium sp.]|uniref:VOC family protein n=1 Tax=Sphingobium sp. TaxID=1912891 RepID=UPI0029AC79E0|nr:VOC family protein [Sphingobium sp.]MDX3911662.1 VOC family protein [Sphingobium sp.]